MAEGHFHIEDAGADTMGIRYLVANDSASGCIHNEPDICLDATDLDISLISSINVSGTIVIVINKGFNADGGSLAVIRDLLVGNGDYCINAEKSF